MQILIDEPLARHGYWRLGGPIDRLVIVESEAELAQLQPEAAHVLGNGSNLLAPDAGLRGTALKLALRESRVLDGTAGGPASGLEGGPEGPALWAGAGLLNTALLARAGRLGLGGLGCLAGVPGTVGGAVAMNAGTALGEVSDILLWVEGFMDGVHKTIRRTDLPMRYREGGLPPGFVASAAAFRVEADPAAVAAEQARVLHHLQRRKATQPLGLPSCGSVFRNPPGGYAGRLIESVGLKGFCQGGAQISPLHANFIVNLGGATALDVMICVRTAWERVRAEAGVTLVPEVHVIGEWPGELWPLAA